MTDKDKLLHYLDGNLSEEESRDLENQLAQNAELRDELALLKRIQIQIKRRPPEPSPGLWAGIEAQLQTEIHSDSLYDHLVWAGKRLVPLMAAAAVILMTVLGYPATEATITIDDYFDSQAELVLSEIDANTVVTITDANE